MGWTCGCGVQNDEEARFCNECGAPRAVQREPPLPPAPPVQAGPPVDSEVKFGQDANPVTAANVPKDTEAFPIAPPKKKSKVGIIIAVVVIGGLLGVCLIGVIAAIAIPNFLRASMTAKQKRAVAEVRTIAAACKAYSTDKGGYPDTGRNENSYYSIVDASKLKPLLEPTYIAVIPEKDPWGNPYSYGISQDASAFVVICNGSDGKNSIEAIPENSVLTSCYEDEIIWENDAFIQEPNGPQKKCK